MHYSGLTARLNNTGTFIAIPLRIPIDAHFGARRLGLLGYVWTDVRAIYWCLLVRVSALFG